MEPQASLAQRVSNHSQSMWSNPPVLPPRFSDIKFNTIGQLPELLKRISAPDPLSSYTNRSTSASPDVEKQQSPPSNHFSFDHDNSRTAVFQSLAARISDLPDVYMSDGSINGPAANIQNTRVPPVTANSAEHKTNIPDSAHSTSNSGVNGPNSERRDEGSQLKESDPSGSGSTTSGNLTALLQRKQAMSDSARVVGNPSIDSGSSARAPNSHLEVVERPSPSSTDWEVGYTQMRALQTRLLSTLSSIRPPNTSKALAQVMTAHSHTINAVSKAHHSEMLAVQALDSAQQSVAAAKESLEAAQQAKSCVADAITLVNQIGCLEGQNNVWESRAVITELQRDLQTLGEYISQQENQEKVHRDILWLTEQELYEREMSRELNSRTLDPSPNKSSPVPYLYAPSDYSIDLRSRLHSRADGMTASRGNSSEGARNVMSRTPELDAHNVYRAWNQHQEQSAIEAEQRRVQEQVKEKEKEKEIEEKIQRAQLEAATQLANLEKLRNDRLKSEAEAEDKKRQLLEQEKKRKEEEAMIREAARREAEQRIAQENFARCLEQERQRKLIESQKAAEAEEARLQEAKLKEQRDREELSKRLEQERKKALEAGKARDEHLRQEQDHRRQQVIYEKQRASAEAALKILTERAREKYTAPGADLSKQDGSSPVVTPVEPTPTQIALPQKDTVTASSQPSHPSVAPVQHSQASSPVVQKQPGSVHGGAPQKANNSRPLNGYPAPTAPVVPQAAPSPPQTVQPPAQKVNTSPGSVTSVNPPPPTPIPTNPAQSKPPTPVRPRRDRQPAPKVTEPVDTRSPVDANISHLPAAPFLPKKPSFVPPVTTPAVIVQHNPAPEVNVKDKGNIPPSKPAAVPPPVVAPKGHIKEKPTIDRPIKIEPDSSNDALPPKSPLDNPAKWKPIKPSADVVPTTQEGNPPQNKLAAIPLYEKSKTPQPTIPTAPRAITNNNVLNGNDNSNAPKPSPVVRVTQPSTSPEDARTRSAAQNGNTAAKVVQDRPVSDTRKVSEGNPREDVDMRDVDTTPAWQRRRPRIEVDHYSPPYDYRGNRSRSITPPPRSRGSRGESPPTRKRFRDEERSLSPPPVRRQRYGDSDSERNYPRERETNRPRESHIIVPQQAIGRASSIEHPRNVSPDRQAPLVSRLAPESRPETRNGGSRREPYRPSYSNSYYPDEEPRRTSSTYVNPIDMPLAAKVPPWEPKSSHSRNNTPSPPRNARPGLLSRFSETDHASPPPSSGRGGKSRGRGTGRGRGGGRGAASHSLEQRISAGNTPTLMHRLEDP